MISLLKNSKPLTILSGTLSTFLEKLRNIMSKPLKTLPKILPHPSKPFPKASFENATENLPKLNSKIPKNHLKSFQKPSILSKSNQNPLQNTPLESSRKDHKSNTLNYTFPESPKTHVSRAAEARNIRPWVKMQFLWQAKASLCWLNYTRARMYTFFARETCF